MTTYVEMLSMIERQQRGGLCFVGSTRHVKAKNKYLQDYNPEQQLHCLMYWDANNLYGTSASDFLPCKHLRFEEGTSLNKILKTADDSVTGYTVEVDLEFPKHLHDKFKECPPAPESLTPKMEWFSAFQQELSETSGRIKMTSTMEPTN